MLSKFFSKFFILFIKFYQYLISPLIGGGYSCKFQPSCSQYMKEAIEKKGVLKGCFLGIWRVMRCNPYTKGGSDPVK